MPSTGIEPAMLRSPARRSNQLSYATAFLRIENLIASSNDYKKKTKKQTKLTFSKLKSESVFLHKSTFIFMEKLTLIVVSLKQR